MAALSTATLSFAQASLRITTAHAEGTLGEAYTLKASWTVSGTARPYRVKFKMAGKVAYVTQSGGAGSYEAYSTWKLPLDGKIPVEVTLDPEGVNGSDASGDEHYAGSFGPQLPSVPVRYFDPRKVKATQSIESTTSAGMLRYDVYFGVPVSETSQVVNSYRPPVGSVDLTVGPFNQLLRERMNDGLAAGTSSVEQSFEATVSNCCINVLKMKDSWIDLSALPAELQLYAKPEAEIQADDPAIVQFAEQNLPPDYKKLLSPIDAARVLFQAVQRSLSYSSLEAPDAVGVLRDGHGDCVGMDKVYLACLRHIGIPCRLVCGWLMGEDRWHCWTEMYLPSAGWIPQDVQVGQSMDRTGTYPYYFSCVPDLNRRVRVSAATTYSIPDFLFADGIQKGFTHYSWVGKEPSVSTSEHCSLIGN